MLYVLQAIYELFRGELDMVDDLCLIMKTYRDSMRSLSMLSEQELETIFGRLEDLQPLHQGKENKSLSQKGCFSVCKTFADDKSYLLQDLLD